MEDLKSFYQKPPKELDAGEAEPEIPSSSWDVAQSEKQPVKKKRLLEKQQALIRKQIESLDKKINPARLSEGETPEREAALAALIEYFRRAANVVKVRLVEPLYDHQGNALKEFAMKRLSPDPEVAEKQREALHAHMEIASRFFPQIELRYITSKDNETVAVVIGVGAEEFNAVVMAEKTRQAYRAREAQIAKDIKDTQSQIDNEHGADRRDALILH